MPRLLPPQFAGREENLNIGSIEGVNIQPLLAQSELGTASVCCLIGIDNYPSRHKFGHVCVDGIFTQRVPIQVDSIACAQPAVLY
jgi:hypothetical protein